MSSRAHAAVVEIADEGRHRRGACREDPGTTATAIVVWIRAQPLRDGHSSAEAATVVEDHDMPAHAVCLTQQTLELYMASVVPFLKLLQKLLRTSTTSGTRCIMPY
jgi:hypothetical protein